MEDFLNSLMNIVLGKDIPFFAAFLMGLVVSISPCTLAGNVSAVTYLAKDERNDKKRVFLKGVVYTLGRTFMYACVGMLLVYFASGIKIGASFQHTLGMIAGPLFILIGLLMLDIIHIHGLADKCLAKLNFSNMNRSFWGSFFLGFILAFAFCPYCAGIYFCAMIPLAITAQMGVFLPLFFALGAAVPILIMSWIWSYSFNGLSGMYDRFAKFELWFRRILALLFILSGVLFVMEYYFE
ncbi:MAG TPA: aromatic aminobenezylarsenical efflux permease ArsG family transporter [Paludibacteraceae bacterium]|nr:aromatic aminobenezylarsenical efflux permease ArsG family transporter [Paludibacteraceae bacterium]